MKVSGKRMWHHQRWVNFKHAASSAGPDPATCAGELGGGGCRRGEAPPFSAGSEWVGCEGWEWPGTLSSLIPIVPKGPYLLSRLQSWHPVS